MFRTLIGFSSSALNSVENSTFHIIRNFMLPSGGTPPPAQIKNTLLISCTNNAVAGVAYVADPTVIKPPTLDDAGIFQVSGLGWHYLASNSPYRGIGTPNINSTLLDELRQTTTRPPIVKSGTISQNTVFGPDVQRNSTTTLDIGYAYPAMDYMAQNLLVEGGIGSPVTLLVTNGAVIGLDPLAGNYGIRFGADSELVSMGLPGNLNRFVPLQMIQENGPASVNPAQYFTLLHGMGLGTKPNAFLRFTDLSLFAGTFRHIAVWGGGFFNLTIQDSQIRGSGEQQSFYLGFGFGPNGPPFSCVGLTNTLFENVHFTYHPYGPGNFHARNNLFKGGSLTLDMNPPESPVWTFYDNLFDGTIISQTGGPAVENNYNAYVHTAQNTSRLSPSPGANDVILTASPAYENGPFGSNYLPATATQLINQGSRTAAAAGLYHYTTSKTADSKEGTEAPSPYQINIGLHYVAANSSNEPTDQDGDGLADYVEDRNGNGIYNSSLAETDWQAMMYVLRDFAGLNQIDTGTSPPDTMGAVGPNHFMVVLNGSKSVAVYDKMTGTKLSDPATTLNQFFAVTVSSGPYAGSYPLGSAVDSRVVFDHIHQRWIASTFDSGSRHVLLAVSLGPDPVGAGGQVWVSQNWVKYLVPFGTGGCNTDYPTLGVDSNGIYISAPCGASMKIAALPKGQFIDGSAQTVQENYIDEFPLLGIVQPAVNLDPVAAADSAWFVSYSGEEIYYNHLKWVNGPTGEPAWQMSSWGQLTIGESFHSLLGSSLTAPQRASATYTDQVRLSRSSSRLMNAVVRKIDGTQFIWTCHDIGVNSAGNNDNPPNGTGPADRSAPAWYKIKTTPQISIVDSGRIFDNATTTPKFYYYPSLTVNQHGDMVIGFSGSSGGPNSSDYISAYYSGKLRNGAVPAVPIQYFEGKDWFDNSLGPNFVWGDYSFTSLDPDGVTIWTIQQYAETRIPFLPLSAWGTRIAAIAPF